MGIVKHYQTSENSKFAMSLQYFKKEMRCEVDFLHADKYQSFLQVDFNTLGIKVSYKVILSGTLVTCLQYLEKEVRDGVHTNWHNCFLMELTRHVHSTQDRKL